ncbi:MAG: type II toxin-antitoxin system VapB family antitoxin [Hyphomonadaceae bacterium]|jgi:Arc/MetJ family transcription regulator|nr:type II toxin-antitoxin system VapB family antitoxin [Hyphomonadaceae bacterium]
MRTTVVLDDSLLEEATRLTGITERSAMLRAALQALVARENSRRLALLGGHDPEAIAPQRLRDSA